MKTYPLIILIVMALAASFFLGKAFTLHQMMNSEYVQALIQDHQPEPDTTAIDDNRMKLDQAQVMVVFRNGWARGVYYGVNPVREQKDQFRKDSTEFARMMFTDTIQ